MMAILDKHCAEENGKLVRGGAVKSEYDFLYVPVDFGYDGFYLSPSMEILFVLFHLEEFYSTRYSH
jgi:hypothetical protein